MVSKIDLLLMKSMINKASAPEDNSNYTPRIPGNVGAGRVSSCPRALYVDMWKSVDYKTDPLPGHVHRLIQLGNLIESQVVDILNKSQIKVISNQERYTSLGGHLKGFSDGIIEFNQKKYVLEIKSINKNGYERVKSEGIEAVRPGYIDQIQYYLHMEELPDGIILLYCKDNSDILLIPVSYNPDYFDRASNKVGSILKAKNIEDMDFDRSSQDCTWCHLRSYCDSLPVKTSVSDETQIEILNLLS